MRELLCGSHRFSELRKGVPTMSPSLLSQRLKQLEYAGIVERRVAPNGKDSEYHLSEIGEALRPIIIQFGEWGETWLEREIENVDLDPALLMWDVRRRVDGGETPGDGRTVARFRIGGVPAQWRQWWLVFDAGEVDLDADRNILMNSGSSISVVTSRNMTPSIG